MEADILYEMEWDNKCIRSTESRLTVMKFYIGKKKKYITGISTNNTKYDLYVEVHI
jgi:hypothetical protein